MKCADFALALLALAVGQNVALAARLGETPMAKVVTLLENMNTKIEETGKSEQTSYDKYSCWCEDTLAEKADDITKAKDKLEELQNNINKNKGGLGSGGATIAQLNKDIAENVASQKEATEVRAKENKEYEEEKVEAEQAIGAMEAAIKVLTGAGAGKKGFLETLQEAKLMSVVGSLREVMKAPAMKRAIKEQDLEVVQRFVAKPEEFVRGRAALGAVQVGHNPFGDYAPQSTQIQGILKGMYDTFIGDQEKDNAEEGEKQKSFEELMSTKKKELATLQSSLEDESKTDADRTKSVADDKAMRDDTREQLSADEAFFTQTKEACSKKATQWAQRSRLRTLESNGISEAIKILSSDEAKKTFEASQKFFLQISSDVHPRGEAKRTEVVKKLRSLASHYNSLELAQMAVVAKTSGHFDDVIVMIDKMVGTLREEEQEDIAHRDRCEGKQNGNKNNKADAEHVKSKAEAEITRLEQAIKDKQDEIKASKDKMTKTTKTMDELKTQRTKDTEEFKKAQKADADSVELLEKAKAELGKFYRDTSALQVAPAKIALAAAKPAPNTNFESGDYKGSTGEARGVLGILDMLIQDITKEMKSQGQDEIDAQTGYEADFTTLDRTHRATEKAKVAQEGELADLKGDKQDQTETKDAAQADVDDEEKLAKSIESDCKWVEDQFEKRRTSRKAEIDGLNDARDFLAGAGTDQDLAMP